MIVWHLVVLQSSGQRRPSCHLPHLIEQGAPRLVRLLTCFKALQQPNKMLPQDQAKTSLGFPPRRKITPHFGQGTTQDSHHQWLAMQIDHPLRCEAVRTFSLSFNKSLEENMSFHPQSTPFSPPWTCVASTFSQDFFDKHQLVKLVSGWC